MAEKYKKHHRRSVRMKGHDYSLPGAYFVTICTYDKQSIFGKVINGRMHLNDLGKKADQCWHSIQNHISSIDLDIHIVMPNHIHGILLINESNIVTTDSTQMGTACRAPTTPVSKRNGFGGSVPRSLSSIVGSFKSAVTKWYNSQCISEKQPLWQRGYYEHIVRNRSELERIGKYIYENPASWDKDLENPDVKLVGIEEPWKDIPLIMKRPR